MPLLSTLCRCVLVPALLGSCATAWSQSTPAADSAATQPAGTAMAVAGDVDWWKHAVIYEIYPRSFQDTNGDGIGDLKGVTQRLDYLQKLGVDAIWLTPFFPSPNADFGYDISNYTDVAPEYGTMADWDELVREARRRGIRVLVDFVVNHTSDQHPWFQESRSSRDNPKRNWYVWRDGGPQGQPPTHWLSIFGGYAWTPDPQTSQWYYHIFLPQQPDVNWADPGLRKAMFDVARFWLDHGASGFRLDATPYLYEDTAFPDDPNPKSGPPVGLKPYNSDLPGTHQVLRELRTVMEEYPGKPVLLGESVTRDIAGLARVYGTIRDGRGDEVQLPMNFLFGDMKTLDAANFKRQVDDAELKLGGQPAVFFLSSHDHPRQWTVFGDAKHDADIAKLTAALTLLERGTALVYYGEEIGMAQMPKSDLATFPLGPKRPRADLRDGNRTPMQWTGASQAGFTTGAPWLPVEATAKTVNVAEQEGDPGSMLAWYRELIRLRKTPVFRDGSYVPLESGNNSVFAFGRRLEDGSEALVVINASAKEQAVTIAGEPWPAATHVLLANPRAAAPEGARFSVAPFGVLVLGGGR